MNKAMYLFMYIEFLFIYYIFAPYISKTPEARLGVENSPWY